ncbi:MAG TPA: peptidylprolyl isomerase [Ignavibacteriaceae bacterium]|nr:peptidylprolyl isomerase [Ignavibacteriaceae bacterium]
MKLCILFAFIILTFQSALSGSKGDETKILASVGNHNITLANFTDRYNNYLSSTGVSDNIVVRQAIVTNMINEIILINYDSNENIFSNQKYLKELEDSRTQIILSYLKDQEIYAKISVTENEIREAFSRTNEKIEARHLYAATEEEANRLYELVKIGVSFESLASQVFTDSVLKNNGGYLGYFTWGDMDPAFEETAYSLKIGEISAPVKTAQGFSIIKVENKIAHPLLTETEFQNKKAHLEKVLKIKKKIPSEKNYIKEVFDRSKLTFNKEALENILFELFNTDKIESDEQKKFSKECVTYNEKSYSQAEIEKKLFDLPDYHKERIVSIETLKAAIEGLLIKDILYNIAIQKGYESSKPVLDMFEGYKKNIFLKYKINEVTDLGYVPDSTLYSYYKNNIHQFSNEREINLQEILLDNQNLADSLLKLISEGSDFGKLAKDFSLRRWTAENDGVIEFAPISEFGSYGKLFWETEVGQIIGPIKIENLYGVFRILGKKDSQPIDFNLVKDEVIKAAQFENQTQIVRSYIDNLRKKIEVKVNNDLLASYNLAG